MKLQWIFIGTVCLAVAIVIWFVNNFGMAPKPLRLINPTQIEHLDSSGALAYRRLKGEISGYSILFLGSSVLLKDYLESWEGLLKTAIKDGYPIGLILNRETLKPLPGFQGIKVETFTSLEDLPWELVLETLKSKKRVIVHGFNFNTSFMDKAGFGKLMLRHKNLSYLLISQQPFVVSNEQLLNYPESCEYDEMSPKGWSLACAAISASRKYFRKKLDENSHYVAMEKLGNRDIFLYIYESTNVH